MELNRKTKMAGDTMMTAFWLPVIVTALLCPLPVFSEDNGIFICPERSNCSCFSAGGGKYEVMCPMTEPSSFFVTLVDRKYVSIQCQDNVNPEDYSMLPSLAMPVLYSTGDKIAIKNCPLPATPLADVIFKLGINELRGLMFEANGNNLSDTLTKRHFNGAEGITQLILSDNGLTDLPEDLFGDMRNLTSLNLRANKIHLRPNIFQHISKLNVLELGHNNLQDLPHGLFKHLTVLKQLNLWQNSLSNLNSGVFDGLESLEELDLSSNKLETLSPDIFSKLPNLRVLHLFNNNLNFLPEGLFALNPKLVRFKLFNNKQSLQSLPEGLLSDKTDLTEVKLYGCKISYIPESVLWGSQRIESLYLNRNDLTEIPSNLLRDQENLIDLNLSDNLINKIPDESFQSLKHLKYLNLDRNQLEELSGKIFQRLVSLEKLTIRDNKLQEVALETFFSTSQLIIVDMSFNNLSFMETNGMSSQAIEYFGLSSPFQKLDKLQSLHLSHNAITQIFSDWRQSMQNLRLLDLSFNKVQQLTFQDIMILNNDLVVNLKNNSISEIEFNSAPVIAENQDPPKPEAYYEVKSPARMVKVLIDQNPLHCDCVLYNFVLYLEGKLDPYVKKLVTVEPGSAACASPSDLEGRQLIDLKPEELLCPLNFRRSQSLCPENCICNQRPHDLSLVVNCSSSGIMEAPAIPDAASVNLIAIELHFKNNMMTSLSPFSANQKVYNQIKGLFVAGNNISSLTVEDIPIQIEIIDLRNNSLVHINDSVSEVLKNSSSLKQLWISGNPIACDCDNRPFLSFLQSSFHKVKDFANVTCPDGNRVESISLGDLCATTPIVIMISVVFALTGLLMGVLAALYYKYQDEVNVWLFAHNLCLSCITETELDKDKLYDAFISFSHKDEDFVANNLVPELEGGPNPFKICLHFRDWVAGEWIPTQIARSVEDSRRTLVVLSPNFLESVWGRMEFRAAHSRALKEGRARVILILYGDIGPTDNLDSELQAYLSMNTYIKWGDPWFWDKLRYALPHPQMNKIQTPAQNVLRKSGFDDRLDLVDPTTPTSPAGQITPPAHQALTNPLLNHVNSLSNGLNGINGITGKNATNVMKGSQKLLNMINDSIISNGPKSNGNVKQTDI